MEARVHEGVDYVASVDEETLRMLLLREAWVDEAVLEELDAIQRDAWVPFGRVAVSLGILRISQVAKVLQFQATSDGRPFGDCAKVLGFMRSTQVEEVVEQQISLVPRLASLLVEEQVVTRKELNGFLREHLFGSVPESASEDRSHVQRSAQSRNIK